MLDDKVNGVYYNGTKLDITKGDVSNWKSEKEIMFTPVEDGYGEIKVEGENYEGDNHCYSAGFIMLCEASDGQGPWHNFKSDTEHWRAEDDSELCINGNRKYYTDLHHNSFSIKNVPLTFKLKVLFIRLSDIPYVAC